MKIIARVKALLAAVCAVVGFTVLATPEEDAIAAFKSEVGAAWDQAAAVGVPDAGFGVACEDYTDKESFIDDQASDYIEEDLPAAMIDEYRIQYVLQLNKCTAIGGAAKAVDEAVGQLTDPSQAVKDIAQNAKNGINALYAGINGYSTVEAAKTAAKAISDPAIQAINVQVAREAALKQFREAVGAAWDNALAAGVTAGEIAIVCEGYTGKVTFLDDYEASANEEALTVDYINGQKAAYVGELNRLAAIAKAKKDLADAWDEAAAAGVDFEATKDNWDGCTTKDAFIANFVESANDEKEIFTPEYIAKQVESYKWFFKMEAGAAALGKAWDAAAAAGVDFEATSDDWEGCTTKEAFIDNFRESAKDDQEFFTPEMIQKQVEYYQWLFELESGVAALEKAWDAAAAAGVDFEATKDLWDGCTTKEAFIDNFRESARDEDFPAELIQAKVRHYVQQLGKAALDAAWDKAEADGVDFEATSDNWDGCTTKAAFLENFDGSIADEPDYFTTGVIQATVDNYLRLFAMETGKVALAAAWDDAETAGVDFVATKDNWDGCTTKDAFLENFEESVKGEPEIFTPAYIQATVDNYLSLFAMETAKAEIATAWDRAAAAGVDFEATKDTWEGCTDKASFIENFEGMLEEASVDEIKAQAAFYVAELNRLAAIEEGKAALDAAWDKAAAASVDFEETKDNWEGCTTKEAFIENFVESAEGEKDVFTAEYIQAVVDNYLRLFDEAIAAAKDKAMKEALRELARKWIVAEGVGVDFEATKDDWEGCTTMSAFLENFAGMFAEEETATQIKAQAAFYYEKFDKYITEKLLAKYDCIVIVWNGGKLVGEEDPASLATNFTIYVSAESGYTVDDFAGYCKRAKGEAAGEYAINFVCTKMPEGFPQDKFDVQVGVFTIEEPAEKRLAAGKVTYPKAVKKSAFLKKKANATWKAKAKPCCVFTGWVPADGAPEAVAKHLAKFSWNELRDPKLKFKVGKSEKIRPKDVAATWAKIDEDEIFGMELTPSNLVVETLSHVKASAKGLPKGLKLSSKTLKVTGKPKKNGTFKVTVSVKNASGYTAKQKFSVKVSGKKVKSVFPADDFAMKGVPVMVWWDASLGSAKGSGVYALPKKLTLKATPKKGYAFAGWYWDPGFSDPVTTFVGRKDYRNASQKLVLKGPTYLFARFVEKTTKSDPITRLRYAGAGYCGADASVFAEGDTWYQGVKLPTNGCQVAFGSLTLPTVAAKGMPKGVKFDAKKLRFTGAPTKAGKYTLTITVKNKVGSMDVLKHKVTVVALPKWAVGNFDGYHMEEDATNGTFTAAVGSSGKVSGKTKGGLASTTFSASSFSGVSLGEDGVSLVYQADVKVQYKVGKKTYKQTDTLYLMENPETGLGVIGGGDVDGCGCVGIQRAWDRKDLAFPAFQTKPAVTFKPGNGLKLKFGSKGKVTVSGKVNGVKASGTTYVLPVAWRSTMTPNLLSQVPVYVAPTRNATGFCEVFDVLLTVGEDDKFISADSLR